MVVALICLSSYRLTRLLVRDSFPPLAVQRARISERFGDYSWITYLVNCSWCAGVWIAAAVTAAAWWVLDGLAVPFLVWGAAASVTGLLSAIDYLVDKTSVMVRARIPAGEDE